MNNTEVKARLEQVFLETFTGLNEISGEENMDNVAEWDSLGHVRLIVLIENTFGVTIAADKYTDLTSFASIEEFLRTK